MMTIIAVIGLGVAMFGIGYMLGICSAENTPKTYRDLKLDKMPVGDLFVLFMGIAGELEKRWVMRMEEPFEEFNEKKEKRE